MAASPPSNEAAISTRLLTRIVIGLIAIWSLAAGLLLVAFQGASSGALGAGVSDHAGQRLVGAHLLVLTPAYLLLLWRLERYQSLLWLPFASQAAVLLSVGYGIITGETQFEDGFLAVAISAIFASLFGFVWISEARSVARQKFERAELEATDLQSPEKE